MLSMLRRNTMLAREVAGPRARTASVAISTRAAARHRDYRHIQLDSVLGYSIGSVLRQTFSDFELLVVAFDHASSRFAYALEINVTPDASVSPVIPRPERGSFSAPL